MSRLFVRELAKRSWCPACGVERTGDDLTKPCECIARPHRVERRRIIAADNKRDRIQAQRDERWRMRLAGRIHITDIDAALDTFFRSEEMA